MGSCAKFSANPEGSQRVEGRPCTCQCGNTGNVISVSVPSQKDVGGSISGLETGEISRQTRCWDSNRTRQRRRGRSDGQQIRCLLTRSLNSFLIAACVSKRFTTRREAWHGFRVHSGTFGEGAVSQHPVILSRGVSFSCSDNRDSQKVTPLTEMSSSFPRGHDPSFAFTVQAQAWVGNHFFLSYWLYF